ncbi:MAG: O-antigen ligase family protein [Tatlockia sp.]|jgi:O-antigen ligase
MEALLAVKQKLSIERFIPFFLAITCFALPLSSTAKSICLSVSIAAILLSPSYRNALTNLFKTSWCKAALALFFIALFACFYSPATFSERMLILEKYSKLLYLPVLVLGFREQKTRTDCLNAFIVAMVITSGLSVLRFSGLLPGFEINPDHVFRNHIMVGYMVDFAAYLCALFFYREQGKKRLMYGLLFVLFSYHVLFVNGGRMGYVIYLVLMALLFLQIFSWRAAVVAALLFGAGFYFLYSQNPVMKDRVQLATIEYKYYEWDKNTPVGFRLQFYHYALDVFKRHPISGNGTGSFTYYFRTENPVPFWFSKLLEPHSQYWLVADEFGLIGLFALLFFFASLFKASWRLKSTKPIAFAMLLPFVIGNFTDSLLLYSGSGYFFILFMALCLGENQDT